MTLFEPKTIWWPTWQGWILFFVLAFALLIVFILNVHDFLAVTNRVENADILVVEAWVPENVAQAAAREFVSGRYQLILISDVRVREAQKDQPEYSRLFTTLESIGIKHNQIVACLALNANDRRSYAMALSVRDTLRQKGIVAKGLNIIAPAAHARKTWLAYRHALIPGIPVGIVSVPTGDYDPARWWATSTGAKWVIANGIGWLYEWVGGLTR